jgi:hypothetical protein
MDGWLTMDRIFARTERRDEMVAFFRGGRSMGEGREDGRQGQARVDQGRPEQARAVAQGWTGRGWTGLGRTGECDGELQVG